MNCKGRRYLLNFCVGLLGGNGQEEWATFCTIVWWSNGGLKGKPPVRGQHVCLADAERSSSQPLTNEYWGYVWLSLALITNYVRLYSWKWVKILLRPFWSHFTYPQSRILSPFQSSQRLNRELLTTQVLPEKEEPSGVHGLVRRILNAFSQEVAPLNTSLPWGLFLCCLYISRLPLICLRIGGRTKIKTQRYSTSQGEQTNLLKFHLQPVSEGRSSSPTGVPMSSFQGGSQTAA